MAERRKWRNAVAAPMAAVVVAGHGGGGGAGGGWPWIRRQWRLRWRPMAVADSVASAVADSAAMAVVDSAEMEASAVPAAVDRWVSAAGISRPLKLCRRPSRTLAHPIQQNVDRRHLISTKILNKKQVARLKEIDLQRQGPMAVVLRTP